MFALLPKNNNKVLKFLNRITDTEKSSILELLEWPASLLTVLKDTPPHIMVIYRMWDIVSDMPQFLKTYFTVYNHPNFNPKEMMDAFSNGQLNSKLWLIDIVKELDLPLGKVWTLCGWIGTLAYLMFIHKDRLSLASVRSFDIDSTCHELADTMNRAYVVDGWKFKATTMDVNLLQYDDFTYDTIKRDGTVQSIFESADTVINTSCEHIQNFKEWYDKIYPGYLKKFGKKYGATVGTTGVEVPPDSKAAYQKLKKYEGEAATAGDKVNEDRSKEMQEMQMIQQQLQPLMQNPQAIQQNPQAMQMQQRVQQLTSMMEATAPNTNVKIVPTIGLNGSNQVVIGPREYIVVGFDLLSDSEKLVIWYSKDFDELRLRANYNYGVTIAKFGSTAYFATNGLS